MAKVPDVTDSLEQSTHGPMGGGLVGRLLEASVQAYDEESPQGCGFATLCWRLVFVLSHGDAELVGVGFLSVSLGDCESSWCHTLIGSIACPASF